MSKLSLGAIQTLTLRTLGDLVFCFFKERISESEERREAGMLRTVNAVWLAELFVLPVTNFFVLPFDSLFSDLELLIFIKSSPPSRSWTECRTHEALDLTQHCTNKL